MVTGRDARSGRSEELVNKLEAMADRPWAEMPFTNKPITQLQLAKMLKPYSVRPEQVRFGELTFKGYMREWFESAFRYIPDDSTGPHPQNRGNTETTADFCEKTGNISDPYVSATLAENSQCFPVSPNQGDPGEYTQTEETPLTRTSWGDDEFSCLRTGEPSLNPRRLA